MHDIVEVVHGQTPIFICFACYATQEIIAFATRLVPASSGEEICCHTSVPLCSIRNVVEFEPTLVQKQKESSRAAANKQIPGIELEHVTVNICCREVKVRYFGWLVAEDIQRHGTSK